MAGDQIEAKVLLVDDEEQFLEMLSERLQIRGIRVDTVAAGEEALAKVEGHEFDAVVLDLAMPGLDGIETLRRLREKHPDLQIIMLTGHGTIQSAVSAMKLGAEDFLEKPIELRLLLEKISAAKSKKMLLVEKKHQEEVERILKSKGW